MTRVILCSNLCECNKVAPLHSQGVHVNSCLCDIQERKQYRHNGKIEIKKVWWYEGGLPIHWILHRLYGQVMYHNVYQRWLLQWFCHVLPFGHHWHNLKGAQLTSLSSPPHTCTSTAVLRYKLSERLDACVLDRPCPENCNHRHKQVVFFIVSRIVPILSKPVLQDAVGCMFAVHVRPPTNSITTILVTHPSSHFYCVLWYKSL